MTTGKGFTFP